MVTVPADYFVDSGKVDENDQPIEVVPIMSGKLTNEGLHLYLFFERNEYPYVFYFKDYTDPDYPLFTPVTGTAKYMEVVTMTAPNIPGFKYAMDESTMNQELTIRIEDADASVENYQNIDHNERTFYYTPLTVMLDYDIIGPDNCATVSVHFQNVSSFTVQRTGDSIAPDPNDPSFDPNEDVEPCYPNYDPNKYKFLGWAVKHPDGTLEYITEDNQDNFKVKLGTAINSYGNSVTTLQPQRQKYYHNYQTGTAGDETNGVYMGYYFPTDLIYYVVFEAKETTMTITRNTVAPIDVDQSFIYHIKGTDPNTASVDLIVVVPVLAGATSGRTVINEVPIGSYTVTEFTDWSWRYSPYETVKDVSAEAGIRLDMAFGAGTRNIYWLSGCSYRRNKFGSLNAPTD